MRSDELSLISQDVGALGRFWSAHELVRLPWLLRLVDFSAINLVSLASLSLLGRVYENDSLNFPSSLMVGAVVGSFFFVITQLQNGYSIDNLTKSPFRVRRICADWLASWVVLAFIAFALKSSNDYSRLPIAVIIVFTPAAIIGLRSLVGHYFVHALSLGLISRDPVAVLQIGSGVELPSKALQDFSIVYSQVVSLNGSSTFSEDLSAFVREATASGARKVVVQAPAAHLSLLEELAEHLRRLPVPCLILTDAWMARAFQRPTPLNGELTAFELQAPPLTILQRVQKRSLDLAASSLGLLLLSPLMILAAVAVKLDSPGPILFRQRRLGFNGRQFYILKFRSMLVMEDGANIQQAKRVDDRVTPVGRFIRATSIDELPQFLNVLRGEMSLIGPRPHAIAHDNHFDDLISDYSLRRHMKPGLTGWAQINGHRGETPTTEHMRARVEHDLWYIANWSIWLDIWIMLRTAKELVINRSVY